MDKVTIDRLVRRYVNLTPQERELFCSEVGLKQIPGFVFPLRITEIKPQVVKKKRKPSASLNIDHLSFEERQKFLEEMATDRQKRKQAKNKQA